MKNWLQTAMLVTVVSFAAAIGAAEAPSDPKKQTSWGLYVDSQEAFAMKTGAQGAQTLLVDVRDPIEIMFTGFTDVVDVNVPYLMHNRSQWNAEKNVFAMEVNPEFAAGIEAALTAKGLDKTAPVVLMCRSGGERGAPSAKMLENQGFTQVYVVVDGFEGDTIKTGERKSWRLVNGWKNANLPWSYTLNPDKMWRR